MGARVRKKNGEAVCEKNPRVSSHADAIVSETVKKNYGVAVAAIRVNDPGAEGDRFWGSDGDVGQG